MMREKSRARRRVRTRVALFLSLASLSGLYLIRLLGAALHAAGLSAVALSTAGTLLCFLLPALAGLFLLDGDQRGLIALRALSAQHALCLAAALPAAMIAKRLLSQGFLCAVLCAALALVITDLLHTVLLTFRQGVELSAALSLTGRELAVTVVLSPLVYLLLRSVHNRILR